MLDKNNVHNDLDSAKESVGQQSVNLGRRRFNAAGIVGSGVLMSLASRSVLATGNCDKVNGPGVAGPSGFGSICVSARPDGIPGLTAGKSPGKWMTEAESYWPIPWNTLYSKYFSSPFAILDPKATFKEVIDDTSNGHGSHAEFYRHIAAQYLNQLKFPKTLEYLTFLNLKDMASLTFAYPTGSKAWDETTVKAYLTQIQA